MSRELRLPPSWPGMGIDAKASYLCSTHQAKNYAAACAMLNRMRRAKPVKQPPVVARLPYADDSA